MSEDKKNYDADGIELELTVEEVVTEEIPDDRPGYMVLVSYVGIYDLVAKINEAVLRGYRLRGEIIFPAVTKRDGGVDSNFWAIISTEQPAAPVWMATVELADFSRPTNSFTIGLGIAEPEFTSGMEA